MVGYAEIRIAEHEGDTPQVLKVTSEGTPESRLKALLKMAKEKYGIIYIQFPNEKH